MHRFTAVCTSIVSVSVVAIAAGAASSATRSLTSVSDGDWRGFRGTDGSARARTAVPTKWGDTENVKWKTPLPGPGSSSPIIVGDSIFVTCWSGYAVNPEELGDIANLRRHLLRIDRATGKIAWKIDVDPVETEDTFDGRMSTHGYASSTPVCDGERVYAFFGKSGVFAYDMKGNELWTADVGKKSSQWKTGSGSSLAMWGDLLLVNASDESASLRALNKETGREVWKRESPSLDQSYGTPLVLDGPNGPVLVLALLGEVWGLDPATGETKWSVKTRTGGAMAPTVVAGGDTLYNIGGQGRERGYAIRLGGEGDVTESHIDWRSRHGVYVATPLFADGRLYWADEGGILTCISAETGEEVFKERLEGAFYASPVRAGDAIYLTSRLDGVFVIAVKDTFELISHNRIEADETEFDGTPAISNGQLYLRSDGYLYCVDKQ